MSDELPNKKKKPDWRKIKASYQRGEGSCRELSERFGVSSDSLRNKCARDKWKVEKARIDAKVTQKVEEALSLGALAWVASTIERANRARSLIDATIEQFATDAQKRPVIDMLDLNTMLNAESKADDMARRSFGLPDTPQKVDLKQQIEIIEFVNPYSVEPEPDGKKEGKS